MATLRSFATNIRTELKKLLESILFPVFLNSLGMRVNALWWMHKQYCRLIYLFSNGRFRYDKSFSAEIRKHGYICLGKNDVAELSNYIDANFSKVPQDRFGQSLLSRISDEYISDAVYKILNSNKQKIESILGTYFQCYWIRCQRNIALGYDLTDDSFGFHTDDNPREIYKIFLYLNDTFESNGAFRTFDYKITKNLIKEGFRSYGVSERNSSQRLISGALIHELNVIEGEAGTILMFDNNLIHKATVPKKGYRDIFQIEIYPSTKPLTSRNVKNSLSKKINKDYPKNPFVNEFL